MVGLLLSLMVSWAHNSPPSSPAVDGRLAMSDAIADVDTRTLVETARSSHGAFERLRELCDNIGARLSGSKALEKAVDWSVEQLRGTGVDRVWTEEIMVPHWVRGQESAAMVVPREQPMTILGLGGTVSGKVEADVVVVSDFDELGPQVQGKVVLFNMPMVDGNPAVAQYAKAVRARVSGPSLAAKHGAVAAMVRSVTTRSLDTPHTGATRYDPGVDKIPAVAVTTEDADSMARIRSAGGQVRVRIETGGVQHPDALSHNVIGEIRGSKYPDEIVLIGAHLDSWDVGHGAHDDGAGVVEVIEAMKVLAQFGKRPERTIRAVLFTNEENGLRGGKGYAELHSDSAKERHVAAIESDLGGGPPRYWTAKGAESDMAWLREAAVPLGMPVADGAGGADIRPLGDRGVLVVGFRPDDERYFDIHHTRADTLDKVRPADIAEATAAMLGLAWRLANLER